MGRAHPLSGRPAEVSPELIGPPASTSEATPVQDAPVGLRPAQPSSRPADHDAGPVLAPRLVVVVVLILAGIVWAVIRGLHFYGLAPIDIGYDLDQPPVLLILVGAWLAYRSARR